MSIVETDATVSEAWDSRAWTWWSSPSAQSQQLVARCKSISKLAPYWNHQTCFWLELGFRPNVPKEDLCRRHSSPVFPVDLVPGTGHRRCCRYGQRVWRCSTSHHRQTAGGRTERRRQKRVNVVKALLAPTSASNCTNT